MRRGANRHGGVCLHLNASQFRRLACVFAVAFGSSLTAVPAAGREVPFSPRMDISPDGATSVVAADVNGDGDVDVLCAFRNDEIAWYENGGSGATWTHHSISTAVNDPWSVVAADMDGDGDIDAVSASPGDDTVAWYENDGSGGGWTKRAITTTADQPVSVYAADVDGDGDIDALSASANDDTIAWYANDGWGVGWTPHTISTWPVLVPVAVLAADIDGDGDVDALSTSLGLDLIVWYENDGSDGTWDFHTISGTYAWSIFAADVDGDGDTDVLGGGDEIAWFENDGFPWTKHSISSNAGSESVIGADIDGDGDIDVLSANLDGDDGIVWYENDGSGDGWAPHTISTSVSLPRSVFSADVDGDGDCDVLSGADSTAWYRNETIHHSAVFTDDAAIDTTALSAQAVLAADLNGDGDLDVLGGAASSGGPPISWYDHVGGVYGTAWTQHVIPSVGHFAISVFAADIDGDGDEDVLSSTLVPDTIAWNENDGSGGTWTIHTIAAEEAEYAIADDLDGDGDVDVITSSFHGGIISWYENDGPGSSWTPHIVSSTAYGASGVFGADVDCDGDTDILAAEGLGNMVVWYESTENGAAWTPHVVSAAVNGPSSVVAGDLDKDGDLDVVASVFYDDTISWYENDGAAGAWAPHIIDDSADGADSVLAADVDGDGDMDVVSSSYDGDTVVWHENDGIASTWAHHLISTPTHGAASVYVIDLDGDGDADVLSATQFDNIISWYPNDLSQCSITTLDVGSVAIGEATEAVLKLQVTHRGRLGDTSAELSTLELLLATHDGALLNSQQANALIETLSVYRDDGDGSFSVVGDEFITSVDNLALSNGRQTVELPNGAESCEIQHGAGAVFFVGVQSIPDAANLNQNILTFTHLTDEHASEIVTAIEDRNHQIRLLLEWAPNVTSSPVIFLGSQFIFADGFESGNEFHWSSVVR